MIDIEQPYAPSLDELEAIANRATPGTDERYQGDAWYAVHADGDGKQLGRSWDAASWQEVPKRT